MVSFFFKRLNEASIFIGTSVNLLLIHRRRNLQMDSLCCGKATLTPVLPIESPAKRVSIGEEKSICKGAFHFQWNAEFAKRTSTKWWAKMDSNHRPHDYQSCALASWAIGPFLVEISGIEPLTSCLQGRRSPSWAKPPHSIIRGIPSKLNNVTTPTAPYGWPGCYSEVFHSLRSP